MSKTRGVRHGSVLDRIINIVVAEGDRQLTAVEALDQIATILVGALVADDEPNMDR